MDKTLLVDRDIRIGRDIIGILTAASLSVDDAFWAYMPQVEEWRLVLSSPIVKKLGVRDSHLKMSNALHKSPLLNEIPLNRISLYAPDDDVIRRLETLEKYRYEGALEVIKTDRKDGSPDFLVFFAPYRGSGDTPQLSLNGESRLQEFLRDEVGISERRIQQAFSELDTRGSYSFENLDLTASRLRGIGLSHPFHPRRIYRKHHPEHTI